MKLPPGQIAGHRGEMVSERSPAAYQAGNSGLWAAAEVEGLPRTTVDLERAHGEGRRRIRRRTGRKETGGEMGRVGALLAWSSNLRNWWFVEEVLPGVNVAEEFARQDAAEVRRRLQELPHEGRRPKVEAKRGTERKHLERLRAVLSGEGPFEASLKV